MKKQLNNLYFDILAFIIKCGIVLLIISTLVIVGSAIVWLIDKLA